MWCEEYDALYNVLLRWHIKLYSVFAEIQLVCLVTSRLSPSWFSDRFCTPSSCYLEKLCNLTFSATCDVFSHCRLSSFLMCFNCLTLFKFGALYLVCIPRLFFLCNLPLFLENVCVHSFPRVPSQVFLLFRPLRTLY